MYESERSFRHPPKGQPALQLHHRHGAALQVVSCTLGYWRGPRGQLDRHDALRRKDVSLEPGSDVRMTDRALLPLGGRVELSGGRGGGGVCVCGVGSVGGLLFTQQNRTPRVQTHMSERRSPAGLCGCAADACRGRLLFTWSSCLFWSYLHLGGSAPGFVPAELPLLRLRFPPRPFFLPLR